MIKKFLFIIAMLLPVGACCAQSIPRPEYPAPQMRRSEWLNLNGTWEFAETDDNDAVFVDERPYPDKIIVPFCRESKLSGLGRKGFVNNVWYRRTFELPSGWKSPRTLLHIGACDYRTGVWINGQPVGEHIGGSASFAFDITRFLKKGSNTVVIHAFDDTRSGLQPLGKQASSLESQGCVYTRTTGIWQSVWLEGVGSSYIKDYKLESDPDNSRALVQAEIDGPSNGLKLKVDAYAGKKLVASAITPADWRDNYLVLNLSDKHLWSFEDPFLYDLKFTLLRGKNVVDKLDSYFGLRKVSIQGAAILINDKPVFQRTVLDQGFYPDGIWTAPTDQALKHDIEMSQAAGFNGARLHQKVFDPRYHYWADKLGYITWGEFPNWGLNYSKPQINLNVIDEWVQVVRRDRNHPSIIGWCPFNESCDAAVPLQNSMVNITRAIDPSRPIIDSSGWSHGLVDPEVLDSHDYDQNPVTFRGRWVDAFAGENGGLPKRYGTSKLRARLPFFVSEYGGIGWELSGGGWGYGQAPKNLDEFYTRYKGLTDALLDSTHFGFCYTQLTDVEQEHNGIYTYDRKPKFDVAKIKQINTRKANYEKNPPVSLSDKTVDDDWNVLVGASQDGNKTKAWRYTIEKPVDNWMNPGFDDNAWQVGKGAFGKKDKWELYIGTPWTSKDIWLRQDFTVSNAGVKDAMLAIHYDDDTQVYINGECVWQATGWSDGYIGINVASTVKKALKPGKNVIAVHCRQDWGGQFIDLALLVKGNK